MFVNVCQSQVVAEATCKPSLKAGSKKSNGTQWNIPYSLSPGREDLDKCEERGRDILLGREGRSLNTSFWEREGGWGG